MTAIVEDWIHLGDPIPIDAKKKGPPPEHTTGRSSTHKTFTAEQVQDHVDKGGNWALVLHFDYIVIDVDAHRNDAANRVAKQMLQDYAFPKTLQVSSRFDEYPESGHYWFRVPADHDWNDTDLRGVVSNYGVAWGEVRHHHLSYVMMPGSYNPDSESEYTYRGEDIHNIPEIPANLYRALVRQAPTQILVAEDGEYSEEDIQKLRVQAKWSLWEFRMAREGTRDDRHYRACMDIGGLAAVGAPDAEIQAMIASVFEYGKLNKADRDTMDKTHRHVQRGMREPKILYRPGDSWWFSRPSLENLYNRALLNLDSPWASLLTELVLLAAATDHRVLLDPWTSDTPSPIALWGGIVAGSGAGKSRIYRRSIPWVEGLPELPEPPPPEAARYGGDPPEQHTEETLYLAMKPMPRVSNPQTGPGLLRCFTGKIERVETKIAYRLLTHYDEPDDLFRAVAGDNYLLSMLRTAFYAGGTDPMIGRAEGQYKLDPGSYCINLLVNIQPYIMRKFRDLAKDGTFQRLIFCETGMDVSAAKSMRVDRSTYVTDRREVAPWHPIGHSSKIKSAAHDFKKQALVRLDPKAQEELEEMVYWGEGDSDSEYDKDRVREWRAMCPTNTSDEVLGHLDVKLQRIAVMLARHDGLELYNGELEVPNVYYQDAKELMKHSAAVVASTIAEDRRTIAGERDVARKEAVRTAVDVRRAEIRVESQQVEMWVTDRLMRKGGEESWRDMQNSARTQKWYGDTESFREMVDDMDNVIVKGKPLTVRYLG